MEGKKIQSEGNHSAPKSIRVTAQIETVETRSHINDDVVANNWGKKVVVVGKQKNRKVIQNEPKLRHPVMEGRLKGGACNTVLNVVVGLSTKRA